jgi:hypothetical protein
MFHYLFMFPFLLSVLKQRATLTIFLFWETSQLECSGYVGPRTVFETNFRCFKQPNCTSETTYKS